MIFNLNYPIDSEYLKFEEIDKFQNPNEPVLVFSNRNGIYFYCDFYFKLHKGIEEPQYKERSFYQLIATKINQIKHEDKEITFTISTSVQERLIQFLNKQFENILQIDEVDTDDFIFQN